MLWWFNGRHEFAPKTFSILARITIYGDLNVQARASGPSFSSLPITEDLLR